MLKSTSNSYGSVAKFFHWAVFFLFVFQYVSAEIMMDMPDGAEKWELYGLHKSFGMIILFLVFLRISWRWSNPVPEMPDSMKSIEKKLACGGHYLLYVAMFVMPLSGYVMSMAGGHGISVFGVWDVPSFIGVNKSLGGIAHETHEIASFLIYFLVGGHVFFALLHHFVKKDNVLKRMLPSCNHCCKKR